MASTRKSTSGPAFERLQYGDLIALFVEDKVCVRIIMVVLNLIPIKGNSNRNVM